MCYGHSPLPCQTLPSMTFDFSNGLKCIVKFQGRACGSIPFNCGIWRDITLSKRGMCNRCTLEQHTLEQSFIPVKEAQKYASGILKLRRLRQEDHEFKASTEIRQYHSSNKNNSNSNDDHLSRSCTALSLAAVPWARSSVFQNWKARATLLQQSAYLLGKSGLGETW